jgi:hypothetical protein
MTAPDFGAWSRVVSSNQSQAMSSASQTSSFAIGSTIQVDGSMSVTSFRYGGPSYAASASSALTLVFDVLGTPGSPASCAVGFSYAVNLNDSSYAFVEARLNGPQGSVFFWRRDFTTSSFPATSPFTKELADGRYTLNLTTSGTADRYQGEASSSWSITIVPSPGTLGMAGCGLVIVRRRRRG